MDVPGVIFHGRKVFKSTPQYDEWLNKRYGILIHIQGLAKMSKKGLQKGEQKKFVSIYGMKSSHEKGRKDFKFNQYMVSILIN
jgi:hypothetical protein